MTVQTSATEFLATLVQCERHVTLFPAGMPVRACLRRQLERQRGAKKGTLGPATKPYCALECAQGREFATIAASVGVRAETCPTCGAALVGDVACEVCMDTKAPAKGFLPSGVEKSERIWTGEVPDVPIGPPSPNQGARLSTPDLGTIAPRRRAPLSEVAAAVEAASRVREAAPRVAPAVVNQEPAKPAEEETMARGVMAEPRRCCDSKGTKHKAWCMEAGGPGRPPDGKAKPALPAKPKAAAARPAKRLKAVSTLEVDLENMGVAALLSLLEQVKSELRRRRDDAAANLRAIEKEIGDALGEAA